MDFQKASEFVWTHARHLDRAIFRFHFASGSPARVLSILRTYQNVDGGLGHALEPDLRTPDSQPLFVEFALGLMRDLGLRDRDIAGKACDYVARHADLDQGIPAIFPSALRHPHADHWTQPGTVQPSIDRLIGLVGLAHWQRVSHPWLSQAVKVCMEKIAEADFTDAHTIQTVFCLLESTAETHDIAPLFRRLSANLERSRWFIPHAPVQGYGLTPLDFAPRPDSFCRPLFQDDQMEGHLDDLAAQQLPDGGWPITWEPPGETARNEWRGYRTVQALAVLKAYGRLRV